MKKRPTATVEITFESPCSGRLEGIAALVYDDATIPNAADTRRHLATCARCRAFADKLRQENRVLRDLEPWRSRGPVPRDATATAIENLRNGIHLGLREHTREALSKSVCLLAKQTLWFDPQFSQVEQPEAVLVPLPRIESLLFRIENLIGASRSRTTSAPSADVLSSSRSWNSISSRVHSLCQIYADPRRSGLDQLERRIRLVRELLAIARDLVGGNCGRASVLDAQLEWFYGDSRRVPDHLANAEAYASEASVRSIAVNDIAVWKADLGDFESAVTLLTRAMHMNPNSLIILKNAVLWNLLLRNGSLAGKLLSRLEVLVPPRLRNAVWPAALLRDRLQFFVAHFGVSKSIAVGAFDRILESTSIGPREAGIWSAGGETR